LLRVSQGRLRLADFPRPESCHRKSWQPFCPKDRSGTDGLSAFGPTCQAQFGRRLSRGHPRHVRGRIRASLSQKSSSNLARWLNYMGGALCYVAREYAGRVKIILRSWRIANNLKDPDEPWADWRP
ncbi:Uncharacterized protein SCF082_LOCUS49646, partial [Durusdinium trenchii]